MEEVKTKGVSPPINRDLDIDWTSYNAKWFYKLTKNGMIWDKILEICWNDGKHLLNLLVNMNKDNSVNWDKIGVNKSYIPQLKMKMCSYWVVKRLKLSTDEKYKYYLNPMLSTYWRRTSTELIREFGDINKWFGYKWNKWCYSEIR